jgi:hypothetical protein
MAPLGSSRTSQPGVDSNEKMLRSPNRVCRSPQLDPISDRLLPTSKYFPQSIYINDLILGLAKWLKW